MNTLNRQKRRIKEVDKPLHLNIPSVLAARTKMQTVQNKLFTSFGMVDVSEKHLINKYKTLNLEEKERFLDILSGPEKRTISITRGYFDKKLGK